MKTILILEDDVIFSRSIGNWMKKKGMATEHAATLSAARKALSAREFDLVLADLRLPDGNSTSLLEWMNERFYATPFLIMTNYGQVENAVEAMQLGAVNYLCKPVQPDRLLEAIGKIFSRPRHDGNEFYRGESAKAREMYQLVGLVARSDISVLIRGASGTGKEHIARELHEQSHRRDKPFVPVDCGTITGDLAKSEFFGHRKGTFTGAYGDRYGLFQVADGGTLFLDEVGELPLSTQARLLRVLETGEYIRVGASDVRKTDVRIVAATNVDMAKAISEGKFRQDLYYRLNTIPISIPALRERGEDVYLLFRKFALEMSEKYKMPAIYLTDEAKKVLMSYSWPGNVRQLKNITENMSITSEDREISAGILRRYLPEDPHRGQLVTVSNDNAGHSFENEREILYQILFDLRRDVSELKRIVREQQTQGTSNVPAREYRYVTAEGSILPPEQSKTEATEKDKAKELPADEYVEESVTLDDYEREVVKRALERNMGRRKETARALGISERTLYRKIKEYGLE
mgnify:CR=1 FL=1